MRTLWIIAGLASWTLASHAIAQTWGQPHYRSPSVTWGQPHGGWGGSLTEWDGRHYAVTGHAATGYVNGPAAAYGNFGHGTASRYGHSAYGDPRAYRPPSEHGYGVRDRGGRYGYSGGNRWTRWSSPPGRGYHDTCGYNDDRAPRGTDRHRPYRADCDCASGPYLYDR
jgi:hypothetical protein